ncbi:10283_t:CDS:2 [Acaulospora morrowiae]|uniref:Mitochondrial import receptor subunit TOM20 n=1 Tax=Acaulospora morrowiae TaxID=94023 RepID=A0A9N9FT34_9GLOM|nr:10283_t:CDS:2 [Acaulospora morrowiae]
MELKKSIFIGMCVLGGIGVGYAVYWDYMRRTNPEFRKKLRNKKRAAKLKKAAVEGAKVKVADFVRKAVEDVAKETFPADVSAKEKYFMEQVAKGESLFGSGEDHYLDAALCFYKALKVYPNPVELIMIYQKTIPEAVFTCVYEMMSLEVKKKQAEYFENFPPKDMNVRIKEISQGSSDENVRRGLFAAKDFSPGDVIFKENPIASALDPSLETGDYCSYCLKELVSGSVHDDSDLFEAVYCSKNCQEKAMNEYAALLFTSNEPSDPESKEARLVGLVKSGNVKFPLMIARFLAKMVHEETQKVATGVDEEYSTWDHIERLRFLSVPPSEKEAKEIKLLRELFAAKVPGMEEFISEERYLMLKGKLMYNAYGINTSRDNERNIRENTEETIRSSKSPVIGAGFYRVASYITHSCDPNTETKFPSKNYELSIVATKHIKAGDELKISYIRTGNRDLKSRRDELEAKWRFSCECTKCRLESGDCETAV